MGALTHIPEHYPILFKEAWSAKVQQMASKLRGAVTVETGYGKRIQGNELGTVEFADITVRAGPTINTDVDTKIWNITPTPKDVSNLFSEFDEELLRRVTMPDSKLAAAHAYGANRAIDNMIVAALTASAYRGNAGTDAVALPASQQVAVDFGDATLTTGLTFQKIARAKRIMDDNEIPEDNRFLGIRPAQMEDLVNDILDNRASNTSDIVWLQGSRVVSQILGFTVIQNNRMAVNTTTDIASAVAWHRDYITLGIWSDRETHFDIRADLSHALQIRSVINIGATRTEELAVVEILCDETHEP